MDHRVLIYGGPGFHFCKEMGALSYRIQALVDFISANYKIFSIFLIEAGFAEILNAEL